MLRRSGVRVGGEGQWCSDSSGVRMGGEYVACCYSCNHLEVEVL